MGRHSAPPSGDSVNRRPLLLAVAGAVVLLVVAVVGLGLALGGGDGDGTTTADPGASDPSTRSASTLATPTAGPLSPSASATEGSAPSASPSASESTTTPASTTTSAPPPSRPPTLEIRWLGTSYVRVRSGGRTLFEDIRRKGATRTFDQRTVNVLIGNAGRVQSIVNGKARPVGESGQIESFTARR